MSRKKSGRMEYQRAPRLGYSEYGISRKRYIELRSGCAAGKYSRETLREACKELEFIEPWIILSVTKSKSYDLIEFHSELGRVPVGRSERVSEILCLWKFMLSWIRVRYVEICCRV